MKKNGFTLIELLVVISIIGILTAIVLVNVQAAKSRSRDRQRLSDIASLQLALGLYYDKCGSYPQTLNGVAPVTGLSNNSADCSSGSNSNNNFIANVPMDPTTGDSYVYAPLSYGGTCTGYHLATILENKDAELSQAHSATQLYPVLAASCAGAQNQDFTTTIPNTCSFSASPTCYDVIK